MSADQFGFTSTALSPAMFWRDGPVTDTKVTTTTPHEDRMWKEDTGGWFRDQAMENAIQNALMRGFSYAELRTSKGVVVLAKFSVRA